MACMHFPQVTAARKPTSKLFERTFVYGMLTLFWVLWKIRKSGILSAPHGTNDGCGHSGGRADHLRWEMGAGHGERREGNCDDYSVDLRGM